MPQKSQPLPSGLGRRIDTYFRVRAARLDLDSQAAEMKKKEATVQGKLVETMSKAGLDQARGTLGGLTITRPTVARITDWLAFYGWVQKFKAFDSLARRLNQANLSERFEHDPKLRVPGLERVTIVKVTPTVRRG